MITIIRGLPGSGKSTLARQLAGTREDALHVEADQFMVGQDGQYHFDPARLKECHGKCFDAAHQGLRQGKHVIVSNTSTQRWEYQPYLDLAAHHKVPVQVLEVHGTFGNVHGVPADKVEAMRQRWEPHR